MQLKCEPELLEAVNKKGLCITNSVKLDGILAIGTTELNRHSVHTGANIQLLYHLSWYLGHSPVYLFFFSKKDLFASFNNSIIFTIGLLHALFICRQQSNIHLFILLFLIFYASSFKTARWLWPVWMSYTLFLHEKLMKSFWWKLLSCVSTGDWVKICSHSFIVLCKIHQWLGIWTLANYSTVHQLDYSL